MSDDVIIVQNQRLRRVRPDARGKLVQVGAGVQVRSALEDATSMTTSAAQLGSLAGHMVPEVRRAVASNTSADLSTLARLAAEFPNEVLLNQRLSKRDKMRWMSHDQALLILRDPRLKAETLTRLAHLRGELGSEVISHTNFPSMLLRKAARSDDAGQREGAARNPHCPLDLLRSMRKDREPRVRHWVHVGLARHAEDPALPQQQLEFLAMSWTESVRRAVARNPSSSKRILGNLFAEFPVEVLENHASTIFDRHVDTTNLRWIKLASRREVASRKGLHSMVYGRLAWDEDDDVRLKIASNESAPGDVLLVLAEDIAPKVRHAVAINPSTPSDALAQMAFEWDLDLRLGVARNMNTPPSALDHLSMDAHDGVRYAVARNPNTPVETLVRLQTDPFSLVRKISKQRLST